MSTQVYTVTSDCSSGHLAYPERDGITLSSEQIRTVIATAQYYAVRVDDEYGVADARTKEHLGRCPDNFPALIAFCTAQLGAEPTCIYVY